MFVFRKKEKKDYAASSKDLVTPRAIYRSNRVFKLIEVSLPRL